MRTKNVQENLDESDIVWIPASIIRNSSKYLNPGDILVSSANSWNLVGKGCWVPELKYPASAGGFISILRGNPNAVDLRYLYHWFVSPQTQAKLRSYSNKTTNISNLDHSRTLATEIPLPPLEEQRRIAAILDKAYHVKELGKQRDLQFNQLELGLFIELFGNPITNALDWPTVNIGRIARVKTGNTPPRAQHEYYGDEVEWIKSDNLNNNSYYATKAAVCLSALGGSLARIAPRDAILVTCIAGSPACIGNCAMVDRAVAFNQQINSLEDIDGNPHFFYAMLRLFKGIVQAASTNSMKGMVSKSKFESICFINPPRELQDLFAAKMEIVRLLQCQANELPTRADTLIQGLHKRLFMGSQVP